MKSWKTLQEIYHKTNPIKTVTDNLEDKDIIFREDNLIEDIKEHFLRDDLPFIYPAKSYAVAIVYSALIAKHFGTSMIDCLCDPELLYNNDPYFVPFQDDMNTYIKILLWLNYNPLGAGGMVPVIEEYFNLEFLIHEVDLSEYQSKLFV